MSFDSDVKSKLFPATLANEGYSGTAVSFADRSVTGRLRLHGFVTAGMNNATTSGTGNYSSANKTLAVSLVQFFDLNESQNDKNNEKLVEFPLAVGGNFTATGPSYCDFGDNYIEFKNGIYLFDVKQRNTNISAVSSAFKFYSIQIFYSLG